MIRRAPLAWTPLFEGEKADDVRRAVLGVTAFFVGREPFLTAPDLADAAVFLSYAGEALADPDVSGRANQFAAEAVDRAADQPGLGLFDGLVGVGWAVEHVLNRAAPPGDGSHGWTWDADPAEEVQDLLLLRTVQPDNTDPSELAYGRAGYGVFLCERERCDRKDARGLLAAIVDRLAGDAVADQEGVRWRAAEGDLVDLGLAHGVAGVVAFLARVVRLGIALHRARPLLEGATRWLLAQQLEAGGFPGRVDAGALARECRLAWCYGDLAVATALWQASDALDRPAWRERALAEALRATERSFEDSGVRDSCFCHGSAGLGHMFNCWYQGTGLCSFRAAAGRWLGLLLEQLNSPTGLGTYRDGEHQIHAGMLEGVSGVGLTLTAAFSPVPPAWGSRFLLWPFDARPAISSGAP